MKPVKLGIIGTGIAARDLHLPALKKLKDKFEIVAVCNKTEIKAKAFSQLVGDVPYFSDYNEMLNTLDFEAVDITVPFDLNLQVVRDCMYAEKHIILEKPLAATLEDAEKILDLGNKTEKKLMVAEHYRYKEKFVQARELMKSGNIGHTYSVVWDVARHVSFTNKYTNTLWRIEHKYPGGFITDAGIHNIAGLRFMFGDLEPGHAYVKCINPEIGDIDTLFLHFKNKKGVVGSLNLQYSSRGFVQDKMIISGALGTILIDENVLTLKKPEQPDIIEDFGDNLGYRSEFENFYNSIRNNEAIIATFDESYKDMEFLYGVLDVAQKV